MKHIICQMKPELNILKAHEKKIYNMLIFVKIKYIYF